MNLLLDTCTLIWLASEPTRISAGAAQHINDPGNRLHVSHASLWEIVLKHGAGKLTLPDPPAKWWTEQTQKWRIVELPLLREVFFSSSELPPIHRDPFDRILVAQALLGGLQIVSPDHSLPRYQVPVVW